MEEFPVSNYPIYFTFKNVIPCTGSVALVLSKGRALMTKEEDGWWLYGVQPGGMAGHGQSAKEAFDDFQKAFDEILKGIASEANDFNSFDQTAREFFYAIDKQDDKAWKNSRQKLKSGGLDAPDDLGALKRETQVIKTYINIIAVDSAKKLGKKDIVVSEPPYAAAA